MYQFGLSKAKRIYLRKGERNMAKRNIFRGLAAVLALGMCMTGLAGCGSEKRADGKPSIAD